MRMRKRMKINLTVVVAAIALPLVMITGVQLVLPQVLHYVMPQVVTAASASGRSGVGGCVRIVGVIVIPLTVGRHPAVIAHARLAVRRGYPRVMVLNRVGAAGRRVVALRGIPTKAGYDRDEYPAAAGRYVGRADVAYVRSGENRSAGAIMGNTLRRYCDGVKFRYAGV